MPVRSSSPRGFADSDAIASAMVYAVDHGARVIDCSFGPLQGDQVICAAGRHVQDHGGRVFVSAGNDGTRDARPGFQDIVLLVDGVLVSRQRTFVFRAAPMLAGSIVFLTPPGLAASNHVLEVQGLTADGQSFTSTPVSVVRRN